MPGFFAQVQIDKEAVLACLGYGQGRQVPSRVVAELERLILKLPAIIEPQAVYQEYHLADIRLSGAYISRKLSQAEFAVAAVVTIGGAISSEIEECFAKGNLLGGMLLDVMANSAIRELVRLLRQKLIRDYSPAGQTVTQALYPGTADWPIEEQAVVFKLAGGSSVGVGINANAVMIPSKSVSAVFGAGSGIPHNLVEDECTDCGRQNCTFRTHGKKQQLTVRKGREEWLLEAGAQETVLDVLARSGIVIDAPCAGNHTCGKCRVVIETPSLFPPTETERFLLSEEQIRSGERLACAHTVAGTMTVHIRQEENFAKSIAVDGLSSDRLLTPRLGYCGIVPGEKQTYGLAIDIGTTTVVVYLVDLTTGRRIAFAAALNPQRIHGADVISRIDYTLRTATGMEELQRLIVSEINQMIARLCREQEIASAQIHEAVVVGNTVMMHILFGMSCAAIAKAPYMPESTASIKVKAGALGIHIHAEGHVASLPSVSGFVGADIVAGIIACNLHRTKRLTLLVDIGTNGEIVLGNREIMMCCSTAAGPAFEGAKITWGMGGISGAIDHVWFKEGVQYSTIQEKTPQGICGSGLVDIIAELLRSDIVSKNGKLITKEEAAGHAAPWLVDRITVYKGKPAFVVVPESGILITQADIREVQLAKGAISAGIYALCETMKISLDDIEQIYLAGGFGSFLNVENAMRIGLLPHVARDKVRAAGNSAGAGAFMALLSMDVRKEAEEIRNKIIYTELAGSKLFSKLFMQSMSFTKESS